MLTVLFYVLLCMAAVHFIYERILLPSVRLHYRNKLFELRDVVRHKIINSSSENEVQAAQLVHEALNNAINRLHLMTLPNRLRAQRRLSENPQLQARIRREVEIFNRPENQELLQTIKQSSEILEKVLACNSLMLLIYLAPVILLTVLIGKMVRTVTTFFKPFIEGKDLEQAVMLLPDRQVAQLVEGEKMAMA
ncbi:hypothetical protein GBN33_05450 [Plesiomonas shigelloides]|uniref:hypothetical protein n=1 Tax=Plesiomonas shigelloides TaxID=703 RepID=UPI00126232F5|nr:hypothetical protein [Plesiomonas shigelloides]KAB7700398.1 hypothetical protein GBN33_05450 [Plesiomonas shigelloides]